MKGRIAFGLIVAALVVWLVLATLGAWRVRSRVRPLSDRAIRRGDWLPLDEAAYLIGESILVTMDRIHAGKIRCRASKAGRWYAYGPDVDRILSEQITRSRA